MRIAIVQRPQDLNGSLVEEDLPSAQSDDHPSAVQVRRAVHFLQCKTGSKRRHLGIDPSCCSKALLSSKTDWPVDLTMVRLQSSLVDGGIQSSAARCAKCSLFAAQAVSNLGKISNPCSQCVNLLPRWFSVGSRFVLHYIIQPGLQVGQVGSTLFVGVCSKHLSSHEASWRSSAGEQLELSKTLLGQNVEAIHRHPSSVCLTMALVQNGGVQCLVGEFHNHTACWAL